MYFSDASTTTTAEEPATETTIPQRDAPTPDPLSCEERCRREAAAANGRPTQEIVLRPRPRVRRRRVYVRRIPVAGRQLGDYGFGERPRVRTTLTSGPPHLPFLTLDNFVHGASTLTKPLSDKVRFLAGAVDASWNSPKPIVEIRLVGHTDDTGSEKFNVGLGDKRAQAVQAELAKFPGVANRVAVIVNPSPGETQPTETNKTLKGMGLNRRVEVFVIFGAHPVPPPPPPPPTPPPCIDPRKCIKPPDQPPPTDYNKPIPSGRQGKSLEQWLTEVLAPLPKPLAWLIRKAVITGACAGLEALLAQAVGRLSESDKEQLRKECEAQAKKPR